MRIQNSILRIILAAVTGLFLFTACGKDKYTTKPQLKFKSAENYNVEKGDLIEFTIEFTDKEGDISDSIYIQAITPNCGSANREFGYPVPSFPSTSNQKGEFKIVYLNGVVMNGYATWPGGVCGYPDTSTFRFWIKDKAKNVSDTIQSDKPLVIH